MNQNLIFSGEAYDVEGGKVKPNELSKDSNYLILDTVVLLQSLKRTSHVFSNSYAAIPTNLLIS